MALLSATPSRPAFGSGRGDGHGEIMLGVAGTYGLKTGGVLLGLAATALLARLLGVDGYGTYAYVVAWVSTLAVPTQMGLPEFVLRQVARYRALHEWGLLRGLVVRANQVVLGASLILALLAAVVVWTMGPGRHAGALQAFLAALVLLPMFSLTSLRLSILRGLRYPLLGQAPEALVRPAVFVAALLVVAWIFGDGWLTPVSAVALFAGATAAAFALGTLFLRTRMPDETRRTAADYDTGTWAAGIVPFMLIGGTYLLNAKIDIVMLGFFRTAADVGVYAIAVKLASIVVFGMQSIAMVANAPFSHHWSRRELKRLQRLATWAARAGIAFVLPVGVILAVGGDRLIGLLFGPQFTPGAAPLDILCIGWIMVAALGPVDPLLKMTGHEKSVAYTAAFTTVFNIGANFALIPVYGAEGAAAATALSLVLRKAALCHCVRRDLGMNPTVFRFTGNPASARASVNEEP